MGEDRYQLRAFIGCDGSVDRQPDMGFSTFTRIWVRRDDKQRYAVVETHDGRVLTFDLYADDIFETADGTGVTVPAPLREQAGDASVEDKIDAAIMSGAMLAEDLE